MAAMLASLLPGVSAITLSALGIHGIAPGRELLTTNLSLFFVLVWSLFLSNWLTSLIGLSLARPLARLTFVPTQRLVPCMIGAAVLGAYASKGRPSDVGMALFFGLAGYLMKKHRWPRVSLVLALVLGNLFELSFQQTLQLQALGRISLWDRPIALLLGAASGVVLVRHLATGVRSRAGAGVGS
ncbi:MAG: tripartite tricarboxylate transporter permease [Candidatus Methylomirabilia bacterium]